MAAFNFKYEMVLQRRRIDEDESQRKLAMQLRQRMILRNQLQSMQQTISTSKREMTDSLKGAVKLQDVTHFARFSSQVELRARMIVQKLATLHGRIEQARNELTIAMRDRKSMELLKENHHKEFKRREKRRETAFLDDVSMQKYTRSLMEISG